MRAYAMRQRPSLTPIIGALPTTVPFVGPEAQEWAYRGGLAAILALMLLVTFNDLGNFGLWRSLAGLIG